MKINSNTISLIIGALVVVGGIWYFFFTGGSGNDQPLSAAGDNPAQTQFAALVSQLQPISFNTNIFQDPNFMALVDLSTPVTPESAGRLDPFAPLP